MTRVYAEPPEEPTYRWECNDSIEANYVGETLTGYNALRRARRDAKDHTSAEGHETIVWRLVAGYVGSALR